MNYTMIKRFYILLLAIVASVGMSWALTPQGTDTWDDATKTLTVNSNPGNEAYQDQSDIKHVVISSTVTSIGNFAFSTCFYLETVIASEGLTTIGEGAFSACENLESVTLPSTLLYVDQHAFAQGSNLKSVTITAPALNDDYGYGVYVFEDTHADLKIYVPAESVETYKTKWSDYADKIVAIGSGSTPAGNSITINASSYGSVVASPTSAEAGATITLTATPDDGYQLKSISGVYVPVSETLNATSETVNGNKFQAQATSRNNNGWRVYNPGTANTLTVSSLNGTTLITKIEFTSTWGGQRKNNMLSVSAGTLSFDGNDPSTTVTINGINATSVTISGSGTNAGQTWCIKSVKVYYEGTEEEELEISDTENANVKTFTMVDSEVTISAEFEAVAPDPEPVVLPATKYAVCNVPDGWAVTANGDAVSPISGRYYIADGQTVVLTPTASMIDLVEVTSAEETGLLGSGTAEDPYLIYTVANWNAVAAKVNDGTQAAPNCRQMANLDGVTTVMGNSESKPFKGIYDGNGFVFSNVNLSITSGSNPLGLFGCVNAASAVVKNVVVAGGTVSSTSQNVGAIVGQLNGGTVQYCANYATVSSSYNGKVRMGGIVGWMRSAGGDNNRVNYCINYGNVSGIGYIGGITGSYGAGNVNYCQNYGSISSSGTDNATSGSAGGIIGWDAADDATKITYNHNGGNITEAKGHGYKPSRYIIANTNSSDATSVSVIVPSSNSFLSSLTLTIGSDTYTGADLATHEPNAQALTSNPEGITISGITYAYNTAAPIAPAPGTNPGTDPEKQSNKTWQFTMPSHNIGLTATINPAANVVALISAIGTVELTAECKAKIDTARTAYDALSAEDKALVTNIATLTTAEAEFVNVQNIWLSGDCDVILWKDSTMAVKKHAGEGNGAMKDYTDYYGDDMTPWFSDHWYDPQPGQIVIKSITIEEGVTRIGDHAFGWMDELKTVTIPASMASIGNDAFYWSKAVEDIYLTVADPSNLTWALPYKAEYQFKPNKGTNCHVPADKLASYQFYLSEINVTFVADLPPIAPTLKVGLTLNANDEFYLGPDTTCFQFNCFSSNRYFFGKGSFRINFESPSENVHTMIFQPKQMGTDVMMVYSNGETFVSYGTSCCATALPTSATVVSGDGTKANPFVLEPDTKGECVQAAFSTLPQAADNLLFDMTEKTLITAGVVNAGRVQYSLDNGANWSDELPKATDPGTYKVHYRVLSGGNACIQGIDYDKNNFVEATIASDPNVVVWDSTFVSAISCYRGNSGTVFNVRNVKDGVTAFFTGNEKVNGLFSGELMFTGPSALLTFSHEAGKIAKAEVYGTLGSGSGTEYNGWVWDADNNKLVWEGTPDDTISIQGQGSGKLYVKKLTYIIFTLVPATPEEVMALINAIGTVEYTAECKAKIDLARKTYERLVGNDKDAITNYTTLTKAETDFATLQSAAVQNAIDKIAAIPTPVVYTEECGNAIAAARAAYNAVLEADQSMIPEASVTKLTEAEKAYADLAAADPVITKIDNIPTPVTLSLATRDSINNARAAYDALTAAQKAVVSNYQKLLDAEAALAGLIPVTPLPEGALSGKFTISANGDQVMFAKGNLQATTADLGANWTWDFAANQWTTIGNVAANNAITGNGKVSANGSVDLFGWSTEANYYGIHNSSKSEVDYSGDVLKDWGENITSAEWNTLTEAQWNYLMKTRPSATQKRGQATVNSVYGLILLPDEWELPTGLSFTANPNNWTANVYEGANWTAMENAGAVFLPVNPRRYESEVSLPTNPAGNYWTANRYNTYNSIYTGFGEKVAYNSAMSSSCYGYPVRLTTPVLNTNPLDSALAVKALIDAIPVPVTLNDSSAIYAAREAYDALGETTKGALDEATVKKLTDAETALNTLLVQHVIDMIDALPNPMTEATTKLSVYTQAVEARAAYNALTPAQKAVVSNIDILEAVEAVFDAIASSGGPGETVIKWDKTTGIAYVGNNTTSPAYEHMTVTTGNGSMFSVFMQARLSFGFNSQPNGGFTFANVDGYNLTKVEIKSTTALTSTMTEVDRMGSGWAISDDYKTATWTGNADSVSIWKGQSFTNYWYTDTILFTIATPSNPIMNAFAAVDKINLIPDPVTLEDACVDAIKDARAAVDSLYENKSLIDDPDMLKLTDAEQALLALNQAEADKVIAKINNIPQPVELKLATRDSIQNARAAYDALTDDQKDLVTNYQDLLDAEAALAAINPGGAGMPAGALSGKFAINADGDQIAFAKGNLQATTTDLGENWTWGFAANQWEVIGNAAANNAVSGNKTVSTNGTVDLFGWSTPMTYYGIHNSTNADYYSDDFREWGENITGATWKTPSPDDWSYIIYDRADAADKQGPATVNGVNGYIFLPDEWVLPSGLSFTAKPNSWTANVYDGDDWTAMENAGAVFLPKSSWRKGNTVTALAYGYYWSSDYNNYSNATAYYFKEDLTITATGIPRYAGIYVRLVTAEAGSLSPLDSAQIVKDLIDAIPVPVTLSSKDAIDAARNAYDALAEATKGALDATTVQKLTDAEDAYAALIQAATDVIALINAIPQPVVYNEACGDSISAARNAYDALSDELKPLVSNYNVLTDAEDTYAALAPRIWTSGDCQVLLWPGDSSMIVSKLPGEGNGVMDNYATKNDVPWKEYQLAVKTLTIESGVTEIGKCAFYDLRNLAGDLVIPEGVTAIHENGFRNCLKLTSITLPSTITLLGDNADSFNNCKAANVSITADPNKLAWNEDFDDFIYSYAQASVHKTTVCHVPADFYEIYVAKFDTTVNVTFVGDLPNALSEAEHQAIDAVKDSIDAIGAEISYPESGAAIDAARSAYDALDDDLKPFVSNYQTLLDAEDAYADAKQAHDAVAYAAIDKINAIPVPVEYSSKAAIDTARVAYNALLDTQKALVPDSILQKLTDAEAAWAAIAEKVEHNVSYMGKDGELKNEIVALLNIPDPAPDFNGYEFVRWDVKAGDFLEEGLRIKAIYTPIITTNPQGFDTLAYNGLAQELVKAGEAKEGHIEYSLQPDEPASWSTELPKATFAGVYAIYYKLVREGHADYLAPEPTMATIAKVPVTYVAPIAYDTLVYNASNQTLIAAGQTQDGTFEYSLDPTDDQSWLIDLPQGMNAGSYNVNYRVIGDMNHFDSIVESPIVVAIAKRDIVVTAPAAYDTLMYNALNQTLAIDGTADFNTMEYTLTPNDDNSWLTVMPQAMNAGSYDVYYRVPGDANHNDFEPQSIAATIAQAPLTITAIDSTIIYGDDTPVFIATYSGWQGEDTEEVVSGLAYTCTYAPGSPIGTYAIKPNSATALNYAITFVDGTLTVNKAHVYVSDAEAQIAKFADGHANAVVLEQGILNGIKLNDPIAHVTTAAFSSADVAENLTITLFYELTGDAALLNNYNLDPTSDIFTNEGVIIEPFIPDNEEKPEDKEATINEGIEIYAYGYCDGSGYSLKYHLESGNPDQYKIDFEDSRFTDVDWTNLVITGKDGTIDIEIPVDLPTGDYTMTVYFRDSRFDWLESRQFNVTFHVNLPETYVRPLFENVIALVDTCHCLTDIQWYWRANSTELWQPIEGANGYYYHVDGELKGEYFVAAKVNGMPTFTCGQADMETLYGETKPMKVKAFPNPVVTATTVTVENAENNDHTLRVVNLMGVEVMKTTFEGNETQVDMYAYPQGNYMITVDGIVVKVMKQ